MEIYIYIHIYTHTYIFFLNKAVPMGISGNQISFSGIFPHPVPHLHSQRKVPIPLCLIMALLYNPTTLGFFLTVREIIP